MRRVVTNSAMIWRFLQTSFGESSCDCAFNICDNRYAPDTSGSRTFFKADDLVYFRLIVRCDIMENSSKIFADKHNMNYRMLLV